MVEYTAIKFTVRFVIHEQRGNLPSPINPREGFTKFRKSLLLLVRAVRGSKSVSTAQQTTTRILNLERLPRGCSSAWLCCHLRHPTPRLAMTRGTKGSCWNAVKTVIDDVQTFTGLY
jgi:hypothetical protein